MTRAEDLHFSNIRTDDFHGFSIAEIATLPEKHPHLVQEIGVRCQHCNTNWYMSTVFMAPFTGCDDCREKAIEEDMLQKCRKYWEEICPRELRETSIKHEDFPLGVYRQHKGYDGNKSLFLYGPSGEGKTRTGAMLIKRALLKGKTVQFLWPEELKSFAKSQHDRLRYIHQYGSYDVLMMDDALLTGAQDERIADFLKDLIDFMQRHQKHMIITSQIGGDDYMEQANKFDNLTKTDLERIQALLRRIRERFEVIPFVEKQNAISGSNEGHF